MIRLGLFPLSILILMTFHATAAPEKVLLTCKISLPNSDRKFVSRFEIDRQRVVADGTNITRIVKLGDSDITFKVDNGLLSFLSDVRIDRVSGSYVEIRTDRKTLAMLNEWRGTCTETQK
jgi:hypothetical protein